MSPRIRTKTVSSWSYVRTPGGVEPSPFTSTQEYFYESEYPGSNACLHIKDPVFSSTARHTNGDSSIMINFVRPLDTLKVNSILTKYRLSLDWEALPSSSAFNLIGILAELDQTVALFGSRFWSRLSYGSVTWGLLPFISDLRSVVQACVNLLGSLENVSYENTVKVPILYTRTNSSSYEEFSGQAVIHQTGTVSIDANLASLLDFLGFHPDIATAWDLIPFSFVVDYLIPVGSFLESFRGGGWVKYVHFRGWETCLVTGNTSFRWNSTALINPTQFIGNGEHEYFTRNAINGFLVAPTTSDVQWNFPSFLEMFNMAYLLLARKR